MDKIIGRYAYLNEETVWPLPESMLDENESLEWKMRYGTLTREEVLNAASYLSAYNALVGQTNERRNEVCNAIKRLTPPLIASDKDE